IGINEVEEGKEYAILISTVSGAWRYLIGDTIKFVDIEKYEIIITGRTKSFLNNCGEHLSQDNMNRAVELLSDKMQIEIREFTVAAVKYDNMFAHKWFLACDDELDVEAVKKQIDNSLKKLNDDYRVERIAAIKDVIVEVYPLKVFYNYMKQQGREGAQNKFPRVLSGEKLKEWEEYLSEK
ncbi:MAG: GH3 auxin-responsive promoter family protein, partial [Bacteroidota bacterium]|nr:GH3 auxin-responsive promoter family protein [Bacteroidota bacterium]